MLMTGGMGLDLQALRSRLAGTVAAPGEPSWDEARQAWNLAVDQRPALVALPENVDDVVAIVEFARAAGLRVAAQGTGHNAAAFASLDDTVLVKTSRMKGVAIDVAGRCARVAAGTLWAEVTGPASEHGLAPLAGSSPDVGVVGYTLGGGLSWLSRRHGLAANSVIAIEIVTAEGRVVRCDRDHEPGLFWALRGGGGSFGVVTAIELELIPIEHAYAGVLWYPIERGSEVLHAWRELTHSDDLADELTTVGRFLRLPPIPEIPEPVRGKSFVIVEAYHIGDPAQADELLAPLRALAPVNDTIATVPLPALSRLHMDPEHPVPGFGDGMMIAQLPKQAIDAFVAIAGDAAESPLLTVELRQLGGALGRPHPAHGALSCIDAQYSLFAAGMVPTPQFEAPVRAHVQAVHAALEPWAASHMYLNFADTPREPARFWSEHAYNRLRRIKAAVDPDDRIRSNQPIPAAR
jgi:FAD/FMN-containing dehydrogenase